MALLSAFMDLTEARTVEQIMTQYHYSYAYHRSFIPNDRLGAVRTSSSSEVRGRLKPLQFLDRCQSSTASEAWRSKSFPSR